MGKAALVVAGDGSLGVFVLGVLLIKNTASLFLDT